MDRADQQQAEAAYQQASSAPIGQRITWSNPATGSYGTVTPRREGRTDDGRICRDYHTTLFVQGRYEESGAVACANPDRSWERVTTP